MNESDEEEYQKEGVTYILALDLNTLQIINDPIFIGVSPNQMHKDKNKHTFTLK